MTLDAATCEPILDRLRAAGQAFSRTYPGDEGRRQPVHTVYGGAHLFRAETTIRLGEVALRHFETYAPTPADLAEALGGPDDVALWERIYRRVTDKLGSEPVEDFRIDFEDGYGHRPDTEEDAEAVRTAAEVALGMKEGTLPPFIGIRIKPLSPEPAPRALRTLDRFVTTLVERSGGRLPEGFVVTLPKVTRIEHVEALVEVFEALEAKTALPAGTLRLELMIETPQSIIGPDGIVALPALVRAARGRCVAAHFGVYDYTASLGITAAHQRMRHPACDFARHVMHVALAGTGIWLSDGATNLMPIPPHRDEGGLNEAQQEENRTTVHRIWRYNYDDIRHSLAHGYYQGWDLHPAQLPIRYAAVYAFFLESLDAASARLRSFVEQAARATLLGDVFDDAATGQALLNYFLRALGCGAATEDEVRAAGLTPEELQTRSFYRILQSRRSRQAV